MSDAETSLRSGAEFPYDHDGDDDPSPPVDWAEAAARGVLSDLLGCRGIGQELDAVDPDVRPGIVDSLSEIIRVAHRAALQPATE